MGLHLHIWPQWQPSRHGNSEAGIAGALVMASAVIAGPAYSAWIPDRYTDVRDEAGEWAARPRDGGGDAPMAVPRRIDKALAPRPPAVVPDHGRGRTGL